MIMLVSDRSVNGRVLREVRQNLPERVRTGRGLPWDNASIINNPKFPPEGYALEPVCAKDAVRITTRLAGTNATASNQNAGDWCDVGKLPSDNGLIAGYQKTENGTQRPRQNVDVTERHRHQVAISLLSRKRSVKAARGHAAKNFPPNSATGRDAMNRCRTTREPRPTTVAVIAETPCDEFAIANGSGYHAIDTASDASIVGNLYERHRHRPDSNR